VADITLNIALGRLVELYNRVKSNDPANSALVVVPLADVLALAVTERSTNGWNRKTLTDADLAALPAPDDPNDRRDLDLPTMTWTPSGAGGNTTDLLVCYDADTTAGTDANIVPCTLHDWPMTADGSDQVATGVGFFRAT
jgi:hypothetical protein